MQAGTGKLFFITLWILLQGALHMYAQQVRLYGQLKDTLSFHIPSDAAVFLVQQPDTLQTRSDANGFFTVSLKHAGSYMLRVTHPDYFDFTDTISVSGKDTLQIALHTKSKLLDEVVIQSGTASRMVGDTMEFTADSFRTRQYSSARELLNQIPGIQINAEGQLVYNGKVVSEITLDGTPFSGFGPDQLLELLRGRDIETVRLFDVKSREARLTGSNDPARNVMLDLRLKEEAKRGYAGKLSAAGGSGGNALWEGSGNVNAFTNNRKIVVFAASDNTASGGVMADVNPSQAPVAATGISKSYRAGAHYDSRVLKDRKLGVNLDYMVNKSSRDASTISRSENLVPGSESVTHAVVGTGNDVLTQSLNLLLNYALSASASLDATISSVATSGNNTVRRSSNAYAPDSSILNTSSSDALSDLSGWNATGNLTFRKRFNQDGRALNVVLVTTLNGNRSDGSLVSNSFFATTGVEDLRQQKKNNQDNRNYSLNATYEQPLWKGMSVSLGAISNISRQLSDSRTYDLFTEDGLPADSLNPLYSSHYSGSNTDNKLVTVFRYRLGKTSLSFGNEVSYLHWSQQDLSNGNNLDRNYFNLLPNASLQTSIGSSSFLNFLYQTQTVQPQLSQIQPVVNNTDPLRLVVGNPGLTQSFVHNFALNFNKTDAIKNRYFSLGATLALTRNAISQKKEFNEDNQEVTQYCNVNGNYICNVFGNYTFNIFKKVRLAFNGSASLNKNVNLLNGQENQTLEGQYQAGSQVSYSDSNLTVYYQLSYLYSSGTSSVLNAAPNTSWRTLQQVNANYYLPAGFFAGARFNCILMPQSGGSNASSNMFLLNLSLGKYLTKGEALVAKLYMNDVLNQQKNYNIYSGANTRSETSTNTMGRYLMAGIIWNFNARGHRD